MVQEKLDSSSLSVDDELIQRLIPRMAITTLEWEDVKDMPVSVPKEALEGNQPEFRELLLKLAEQIPARGVLDVAGGSCHADHADGVSTHGGDRQRLLNVGETADLHGWSGGWIAQEPAV